MTTKAFVPLVALAAITAACEKPEDVAASPGPPAPVTDTLRFAASGGFAMATGPVESLDVHVDGDVVHALVSTVVPGRAESWALYYVPLSPSGDALALPVRVDAGTVPPHRPSHGGDPQIAARGRDLVAVWTTKGSGYKERGPLQTALSRDAGRTWTPGGVPAPVDDRGGQAFIDVAADDRGDFHVVWLDDRGDPKGLYHGVSSDVGRTWRIDSVVDDATCQCCWNRLVRGAGDDLYVLYRDANPRDMAVAHRDGEAWRSLGRPGTFDWAFEGCPHVGGGLAVADDGGLHATMWTGEPERTGLFYARRVDDAWQPPHLLAADGRHSDVAVAPGGRDVVAVWDMRDPVDDTRAVFRAASRDGGATWSRPERLSGAPRSGYPRVFHLQGRFRVVWVEEPGEDKVLRFVTL